MFPMPAAAIPIRPRAICHKSPPDPFFLRGRPVTPRGPLLQCLAFPIERSVKRSIQASATAEKTKVT